MTSKIAESSTTKRIARLTKSSKILKEIIEAIQDKKGEHVITLDLRKIPEAVSDFFIVCEASSTVQVRAIAEWVETRVKKECGELPYKHEGMSAAQWILVDYINVVVHVFLAETRKFYRLEEMWSDAVASEEAEDQPVAKPASKPASKAAGKKVSKTASKGSGKAASKKAVKSPSKAVAKTAEKTSKKPSKKSLQHKG